MLTPEVDPILLSPFQRGDRLPTPESDVYRRQLLTSIDDLLTEIIQIVIMAVDP